MTRACFGCVALVVAVLGFGRADEPPAPPPVALPPESALAAVLRANDGRVPATGEQLWSALRKVGTFAQLPVPFSSVRLSSGLTTPRVVIAPHAAAFGRADATAPNLDGRLFLAANMDRTHAGDPKVTSVEFISWNPARGRFDFGVIEDMGGAGTPRLTVVDAGRCFACHRNRGPILGVRPWSNTTHDDTVRLATAAGLKMTGTHLPQTGPFVLPWTKVGATGTRDRVDGMALATPEAVEVDAAVRRGAALRTSRDAIRMTARTPEGRKALLVLLAAVTDPATLEPADRKVKAAVDVAMSPAFNRFATDWVDLHKAAGLGTLIDPDPMTLVTASGVRPPHPSRQVATVPGLTGGSGTVWTLPPSWWNDFNKVAPGVPMSPGGGSPAALKAEINAARQKQREAQPIVAYTALLTEVGKYDAARALGAHGLTPAFRPSNPKAFVTLSVARPARASDVLTPALVAGTVGLSDGDRRFLSRAVADAARRVGRPKVTAASLAKEVFEGPQFAALMSGGPVPDRDEFKDRFAAGLNEVLTTTHGRADGFTPGRSTYASGPRYDAAVGEREAAVVPTTACLRCHEVSVTGKTARFDPIPPLAFDPFDPAGRVAWLQAAEPARKREVLARLVNRLVTDADMPPADAPEYDRFRTRDAAAFDDVARFLSAELARATER